MTRKISQAGIRLIQNSEGCRLTAYKPVATEKYWTIGWGHYGPDVKQGMTITQAQADAMLVADLAKYEAYVNNPAYVPVTEQLNQNQFDALVSFCYNCGAGNLRTLCKGRTVAQIVQAIPLYDKAGGKVLAGLTKRRKAEVALFNTPVEDNPTQSEGVKVVINDKLVGYGSIIEGHVYLPLRQLGEALDKDVHWDNVAKLPYVDGKAVEEFSIINDTTYVGVRAAAELLGAQVTWNGEIKKVFIYQ